MPCDSCPSHYHGCLGSKHVLLAQYINMINMHAHTSHLAPTLSIALQSPAELLIEGKLVRRDVTLCTDSHVSAATINS
jgi:hypothetical protein